MRIPVVLLCSVLPAACALAPAAPAPFSAPRAGEPAPPDAGATWLPVEGAPASALVQDDDDLDDEDGQIRLLLGQRHIGENSADDLDLDDQFVAGLEYVDDDVEDAGGGLEFGLSRSADDSHVAGTRVEAELIDAYIGWRQTFGDDDAYDDAGVDDDDDGDWEPHPYAAIGAAIVDGDVDVGPDSDHDRDWGAYLRFGVDFEVGDDVTIGLDYRHMFLAELHVAGSNFDADSDQLALTFGFPF